MRFFNTIVLLLLLTPIVALANSEPDFKSRVGFSASVQNSHSDISLPIVYSPLASVAPALSFYYVEGAGVDIGLGIIKKFFSSAIEEGANYFISVRSGVIMAIPDKDPNTFDYIGGIGIGNDYFFSEKISIGIEAQLNITKSDKNSGRFSNQGGVTINTASLIALSIYF